MGSKIGAAVALGRPLALALVVWLAGVVLWGTGLHGVARATENAVTCVNPASGAHWQIRVDYERNTVDSYPARITEANISWHDTSDGGNYTLDRKSGNLTVVVASSTGGYFLYDHCKLDN
jgi:hypothetical protein